MLRRVRGLGIKGSGISVYRVVSPLWQAATLARHALSLQDPTAKRPPNVACGSGGFREAGFHDGRAYLVEASRVST